MSSLEALSNKSSEELIKLFQDPLEPEGERSFFVLVNRFGEDLLKKCEVICAKYGHGADVAEIVTENTFIAYGKSKSFSFDPSKMKGDSIDESFQIYLYGIARNEVINFYRKKIRDVKYDGNETIITDMPTINLEERSTEEKFMYNLIQSLPDHLRVVYLTYKTHEKIGCNLPAKLQAELRVHLGNVKQVTVRGYKKEAIQRINQGLEIFKTVST